MIVETGSVVLHGTEYHVSRNEDTGIITVLTDDRMIGTLNTSDIEPMPVAEVVETEPIVDDEPDVVALAETDADPASDG